MKKLSTSLLANLVATKRKELKLTQQDLADATGINRAQISRLEKEDYLPSIPQLEQLGETLGFEPDEVFVDNIFCINLIHTNCTSSYAWTCIWNSGKFKYTLNTSIFPTFPMKCQICQIWFQRKELTNIVFM